MNAKLTSGFTLIELMITITVGAILLGLAVPNFRALIKNNRMTTQANMFIGDLNLARRQASKEGFNTVITATNAGNINNEFGPGWTIWIDRNADFAMDAGEQIRIANPMDATLTLDNVQDVDQIQYLSTGLQPAAAGLRSFDLCDDRTAETGRQVSISAVGRVRINREFPCP